MGPLQGVTILDMTSVTMGPYATQTLGDYGADVIKVESPEGDITRQLGPMRNPSMGPMYMNLNRNKRSICIDLKNPAGRAALLKLAARADVLVYNVRPQAMERLKLGYDDLAAINPRLIYAGVFGFGQDGPYAARPAYDDLIQGGSTLSYIIARGGDGTPRYSPNAVADRTVGLTAVTAILASLVHRDRTGRGQRVDIPMFETMTTFVLGDHMGGLTFDPPLDAGGYARQMSPERRPFKTSDAYVCAVVYTDKHWDSFFKLSGREDLRHNPKFSNFAARAANVPEVYGELDRIFQTRPTAEWIRLLDEGDIPAMPMHDFASVFHDPHLEKVGLFETVEHPTEGSIKVMRPTPIWSDTPAEIARLAPGHGEHSVEILKEAGVSDADIEGLIEGGAVHTTGRGLSAKPQQKS